MQFFVKISMVSLLFLYLCTKISDMKLILFILFCMWVYSYFRFLSKINYKYQVVKYLEMKYASDKDDYTLLQLGSAYMEVQLYKSAKDCFEKIDFNHISSTIKMRMPMVSKENIRMDIDFCSKPLPWSHGAKNHNKSWLHNFLLYRFGGRRINLVDPATILEVNSSIRRTK